jgi:hypothetical protein
MTGLVVDGVQVATYIPEPELDIRLAPRPYFHPVRTLGGTVVTDELPQDHPWHLGVSLTMQDVDGVNVWGGRTYVRDEGYVWRDDHGRVRPVERHAADGGFTESLHWCDGADRVILREQHTVTASAAAHGWELSFSYALSTPGPADVLIGSPATNGRTGGAGYGGFFWRATEGKAVAFTGTGEDPHGSAADWLALTVDESYTLVFRGLRDADRWFVRTSEYNGVCTALAYTDVLTIPASSPLRRTVKVLIADGALSPEQIEIALEPA